MCLENIFHRTKYFSLNKTKIFFVLDTIIFPLLLTDILPPEQDEPQHSLLLPLRGLGRLGLQLAELLAVAKDDVHVLVEGLELPDEGARVLQDDAHPVVDVLRQLVVAVHHHLE